MAGVADCPSDFAAVICVVARGRGMMVDKGNVEVSVINDDTEGVCSAKGKSIWLAEYFSTGRVSGPSEALVLST